MIRVFVVKYFRIVFELKFSLLLETNSTEEVKLIHFIAVLCTLVTFALISINNLLF